MEPAKRHTVLVVDDEIDVVESLRDLLRFEHRVLGATRALDALEILEREEVHVVLSDQRMPGMTGVEFLHEVRERHPRVVRVMFTGYADLRSVLDAINEGSVYRYITKPWDIDELMAILRAAVERYDLADERRRLTAELQRKNADLERANAELAAASELKTMFIRVAGHELRTPLTVQLGLLRLASRAANVPGPVRDLLARVERAGQRLAQRVEQLMGYLHAGQFARGLDRRPVDLAALVRQSADEVRPFIERRGQELVIEAPDDLGGLPLDAAKIGDCLNQLLLNAIKFTPDGGRIELRARRTDGGGARIEVTDSGRGIAPGEMEHLFKPFFTGFNTAHHTSGQFEFEARGLGLGLSLVRAFVELHGGTVSARSEEGRGATFTIDLPNPADGERAP
jgi:signal transduction histidine kinase